VQAPTISGTPRLHFVVLAGLLFAGAGDRAFAAGAVCKQDCKKGPCAQVLCAKAGPAGGYCRCGGGALSWDGTTYSAWCAAWGQLSSCVPVTPVLDPAGHPIDQPAAQITQPSTMADALRAANPWVATLVSALQDGTRWVDAPAQGLLHDSSFDTKPGALSHATALPFTGQVTTGGLGTAQIDIVVSGDLGQLSRLKHLADAVAPGAIPPREVHGTVSAGGLHGALLVTGNGGKTQAIQW
jgi:hypothetical protein